MPASYVFVRACVLPLFKAFQTSALLSRSPLARSLSEDGALTIVGL